MEAASFDQNYHPFMWETMVWATRPVTGKTLTYWFGHLLVTSMTKCEHFPLCFFFFSLQFCDSRCWSPRSKIQNAKRTWVQEKSQEETTGEAFKLIHVHSLFYVIHQAHSFSPFPPRVGDTQKLDLPLGKSTTSVGRGKKRDQWPGQTSMALAKDILEWNSRPKLNQQAPGGNQERWESKQYALGKSNSVGSQLGCDEGLMPVHAFTYSFILQILIKRSLKSGTGVETGEQQWCR